MGNKPSAPQPGTKFQVIGAGISRTGTASLSEALRILLEGPVYHGGTQATLGPEKEVKTWIEILSHFPPKDDSDHKFICNGLKGLLDGYAACTDAPSNGLVQELLEVFPEAKVIVTTRNPESWVKSTQNLTSKTTMGWLGVVLWPVPTLRYFPQFADKLGVQWTHRYGREVSTKVLDRQYEYLREVVPPEKLFFFDVKDGWEPLCKALGKPIPDVPFPRINDSEAIERIAKKAINRGLARWGIIFATVGVAATAYFMWKA